MNFKEVIATALSKNCPLSAPEIEELLEVPPNPEMGDYALPCFALAKHLRKAPPLIAQELAEKGGFPPFIDHVEVAGGYLNFFVDKSFYVGQVLGRVLAEGARYGSTRQGEGRTICIDYSSINIAKRFHIGHLSTTVIGNALKQLYTFLGYRVIGINHLGDWGTQFGKMIAAYLRWGDKAAVEAGGVDALSQLYVRFHEEAEKDPALEDEGRLWFKKIEDGDETALSIFNWFKELTLKDAQRVYDMLGITFDSYAGESFYNDKMDRVIDELKAKDLLVESQGAYVVPLDEYGLTPCLILKQDGATLYSTRDIAAALYRKDTYDFDKCLYVVAYQQNLHFTKWFHVVEKMGYPWYKDLEHVAFGMISYEGQTLSTRKGVVVYLDELLERSVEKALAIIEEKSPDLEDKETVARQVGIGSVVFMSLFNNRIKDIDFWWDRALNFDGETAPYVQYTHARCCSVLRKAGEWNKDEVDYGKLCDSEALEVVRLIETFPGVLQEACQRNEPSLITRHAVNVAQTYNKFYYEHRILQSGPGEKQARLALTWSVKTLIATALGLIGIAAPERM